MKTKALAISNVDFENPEELSRFRAERDALLNGRKTAIIANLKDHGDLDEDGHWVFKKPFPDDMLPNSTADFKH